MVIAIKPALIERKVMMMRRGAIPIHSIAHPIPIIGNVMNPIDNVSLLVAEQSTYIKTSKANEKRS
jgi:hypothetical protein